MRPGDVLFGGGPEPVVLPVCDHYAGREAMIRKSLALQAELGPVFDVTADCEDGAEVGREREHAEMVGEMLRCADNRFDRLGVRIHDPGHHSWHTDIELVIRAAGDRLAFVTIPKVDGFEAVDRVVNAIDDVCSQNGVRREIPVQVLIETHGALREVQAIASHPRVECLAFGLMDYVSAFNGAVPASAMASPGQFEHPLVRRAKTEVSVGAHAAGKVPAHNVCVNIGEPEAAGADARRAAVEYGFTRMWSIHPSQVRPIVAALTPEPGAIQTACEILMAAQSARWGPIRHGDRLQDRASYRYWWGLLRRARAAGAAVPAEALSTLFH